MRDVLLWISKEKDTGCSCHTCRLARGHKPLAVAEEVSQGIASWSPLGKPASVAETRCMQLAILRKILHLSTPPVQRSSMQSYQETELAVVEYSSNKVGSRWISRSVHYHCYLELVEDWGRKAAEERRGQGKDAAGFRLRSLPENPLPNCTPGSNTINIIWYLATFRK